MKDFKNVKFNFVLSGGAAKGFVHLGVIKAFEEIGIKASSITGTSAGALFGGLYAVYGNYKDCKEKIDQFMSSQTYMDFKEKYFSIEFNSKKDNINENKSENIISFFKRREKFKDKFAKFSNFISEKFSSVLKSTKAIFNLFDDESLIALEDINKVYQEIFNDIKIENLKIPFVAVSTDINSKSAFCFSSGLLSTAVSASTAIPFIFPSIRIGDKILYDGGIVSNLPINESIEYFKEGIFIGVDLASPPSKLDEDANFLEIVQQIISTSIYAKQISDRKICDFVLTPIEETIGLFDFELKEKLIERGYNYVISRKEIILSETEKMIKDKNRKSFLFKIFKI